MWRHNSSLSYFANLEATRGMSLCHLEINIHKKYTKTQFNVFLMVNLLWLIWKQWWKSGPAVFNTFNNYVWTNLDLLSSESLHQYACLTAIPETNKVVNSKLMETDTPSSKPFHLYLQLVKLSVSTIKAWMKQLGLFKYKERKNLLYGSHQW